MRALFPLFSFFHAHRSRREPRIGGQCPLVSGRREAESSKGGRGLRDEAVLDAILKATEADGYRVGDLYSEVIKNYLF